MKRELLQGFAAIGCLDDGISELPQGIDGDVTDLLFVFDDQNDFRRLA
jgi:hypothetical protein